MVSGLRVEGGTQILSAGVRKTIQSIKEIVGNHSDIDIYWALKETNMDPNETAQKLLNQDTFHEVKRKRDKKKENMGHEGSADPRRYSESVGQGMQTNTYSDRNVRKGAYARNVLPGVSKEFRVVRDNRVNRNVSRELKSASPQRPKSVNEKVKSSVSGKGPAGSSGSQKPSGGEISSQPSKELFDSQFRIAQGASSGGMVRKEAFEEKRLTTVSNAASRVQAGKANTSQPHFAVVASSSSTIGVYSSSTDPVHVPSPDSRSSAAIGAIKREVGVVGVRRQSSDSKSSIPSGSLSNSLLGGDGSTESFRSFNTVSKNDQLSQASESVMPGTPVSRSFLGSQYNSRQHQQPVGHQKASQPNKEWKPKSSQKPSVSSPGVIGTPTISVSPPAHDSKDLATEAAKMQDKLSRVNIYENQNVIIAKHIRVPETDRCRLTFGSIGVEFDSARNLVNGFQTGSMEESNGEPVASLSASIPESSNDDASGSKLVDSLEDQVMNSGSDSPPSAAASDQQLTDKNESSSPQNLDSYGDIGLVRDNSPSYAPSESHQQVPPELPGFSAYDPQTGYDIPYFRPTMDETLRGQGLISPQEGLSSHNANSSPASTIAMVHQQQQPPVAQMYPQVHVSHFANLMPYRQFVSPVYVPPMAMPGFSSNPAYPHPSSGNSYVLMPGGGTHLNANSLKYGVPQFKPVPAGSPTGFGNFSNPNGYAINAPGVVGGATGLEDSSRIKYKDGNLYVPSPQAETSEIWIQNPREIPGLQSTPYYNMPGQTPHAAYLPSHTGHASFNAAAAQSSHMQFPGLYHPPPQPAAIANPHHLGPAMGGNVGVGVAAAAPGAQVGAYQQPQLSHLNWTTNF
ncbi:GBF-interacting protein 1-like isoform X2 [Ziziphus jujuba]|uniref:GBF-interacting protein 1-like isoform X2 n=1 Tax=Ziziphus jujuba TaxID=326968 RepID=A0A6P3YRC4_ZIZJJ|nr:GBF-interacting protein 1-like isoform X2 [Ziziphus jujuba]